MLPPGDAAALVTGVELLGPFWVRGRVRAPAFLPRLSFRRTAHSGGAVEREDVVRDEELLVGAEAEDLLDRRDLVGPERVAVRFRRVLELGRRVADVRAQHDERRPLLLGHAVAQRAFEDMHVLGDLADLEHVPSIGSESSGDVVGVRELSRAVDGDVVVVVDRDKVSELEVPCERRRFVADALHEVAVAADGEHVVVRQLGTEALAQVLLRERDPDRIADALPERPSGDLDALGVPLLGMAGRA